MPTEPKMQLLPMCISCKRSVDGIAPFKVVQDEGLRVNYHVHKRCFYCVKCDSPLTSTTATVLHGTTTLVCTQDFLNIKYPKCRVCSERCVGDKVDKGGQSYHATCYKELLHPAKFDPKTALSIEEIVKKEPSTDIHHSGSTESKSGIGSVDASLPAISVEDDNPQVKFEQGSGFSNQLSNLPERSGIQMQHLQSTQPFFFNETILPTLAQQTFPSNIYINMNPTNLPIQPNPDANTNYLNNFVNNKNQNMFTYQLKYPNGINLAMIQPTPMQRLTGDEQIERRKFKAPYTENGNNKHSRTSIDDWQKNILTQMWNLKQFPSGEERRHLAKRTGLHPRQVQIWFQNMRSKSKKDFSNQDGIENNICVVFDLDENLSNV